MAGAIEHHRPSLAGPPSALNRSVALWGLSAVMLALGVGVSAGAVGFLGSVTVPFALPWWGLAAMFAVVDACMVHFHFRRDAHSVTLAEIPLVLGLFFASPGTLLLARFLGAALALGLVHRQRPVKLAFNVGLFGLDTALGVLIFRALAGDGGPLEASTIAAVFLATGTATALGAGLVFLAISIREGGGMSRQLPRSLAMALVVTAANTSLGLLGAALLWRDARAAWLLLVPAGVLLIAYRAYLSERKKQGRLEFLYETTQELQRTADIESASIALLGQARSVFRADLAELVIFPSTEDEPARHVKLGPGDSVEIFDGPEGLTAVHGAPGIAADGEAVLLSRPHGGRRLWGRPSASSVSDAMVSSLRGDNRVIGSLLVGNRLGDLTTFDLEDFRLFETLANHAGASLELIELGQQLRRRAYHDALTELPNWAFFRDQLVRTLAEADSRAGVLVFDLDDFKTINDSLGHAAGDQLLVSVAERLVALLGSSDHVARLGGDEFAVLVSDASAPSKLAGLADSVIGMLAAPFMIEAREVVTSATVGIALASHRKETADDLLRNADLAMYEAKGRGKARVATFEPRMHAAALKRLELKAHLETALAQSEFVLQYQPIVELDGGRIVGVEALVRWQRADGQVVSPADFIPLAEETGMIVPIGRWVLDQALRQCHAWHEAYPHHASLAISVNLSAVQVRRPELVEEVARTLGHSGLDPSSVTLEITESVFLVDAEAAVERLRALKELGVRLAVDDFGTGYSSLSYLTRFAVDVLKIPKPFVDGLDGSGDAALAGAIIGISESLGLATVAEGVETAEQRDQLAALGCRLGQGYFFARPLAAAGIELLLAPQAALGLPLAAAEDQVGAQVIELAPNRDQAAYG